MYIKPHANTEETLDLVKDKLHQLGIDLIDEGSIAAKELDEKGIIDRHFRGLAMKALKERPEDAVVQPAAKAAFEKSFDLSWQDALDRGLVCNAREAMRRLGCDEQKLDELWTPLQLGHDKLKFGSGFYVGRIKDDLFVVNGFYMAMRDQYTHPGHRAHWLEVGWLCGSIPWEDFRNKVIGATDPAHADPDSLRGLILRKWKELGLPNQPHVGENAVHGSASALEALLERLNWRGKSVDEPALKKNDFIQRLKEAGVDQGTLNEWSKDPILSHRDKSISVFDLFENKDARQCLELARDLEIARDLRPDGSCPR